MLGAGASADCSSEAIAGASTQWRPPLVQELFETRFASVLNQYPLAQFAAADIRRLDPSALSIERFLKENYAGSTSELTRRKFLSVPLYLQHLLLAVSTQYTPQPDNYDLLISRIFEQLDLETLFVTLNYDLLLDRRLDTISPLDNLDDYLGRDRGWSLIKLHGSVDWGRRILGAETVNETNPSAHLRYADGITLCRGPLSEIRGVSPTPLRRREVSPHGPSDLYPCLSVPLGEEDELACPSEHTAYLIDRMQLAQGLHLLVIGYSAIDREVLHLIGQTDTRIRTTAIINRDKIAATEVYQRLDAQLRRDLGATFIYERSFNDFVQQDGWDRYLRHVRSNGQRGW